MEALKNMPPVSIAVISVILALFAAAVIMLLAVCIAYRRQTRLAALGDANRSAMLNTAFHDFSAAYKAFGQETNTPAIITSAVSSHMGFALFCERFLSSAVSLFVTLGLFGTFLGLSMSVASLTELLSYSNNSEWLGVLDSVGGGLMSALSGMGVAFYTSLVGVACSILLTILRSMFSTDGLRSGLETEMELWLDHRIAPRLQTDRVQDENALAEKIAVSLNAAADKMEKSLQETTTALSRELDGFRGTVAGFNQGVRDFSEFDYNLRGTVERMDVAVRTLTTSLRRTTRELGRSEQE